MHAVRKTKQHSNSNKRGGLEIRMTEIRPFRDLLWAKIIEKNLRVCREYPFLKP